MSSELAKNELRRLWMPKPKDYIRIAEVDKDGNPILEIGEGAVEFEGVWYVIDDGIELQNGI